MRRPIQVVLLVLFAFATTGYSLAGQQRAPSKPFDLIQLNHGKFIYGADYYPEAWNESKWTKDAEMMQAAGINFVRMGEFAWVKMEPEEGHYDFSWLDRALKVLSAHGIHAILGTPTAAPPAWLYAKYPDIAAVGPDGIRYRFGSRRDYNLSNPHFIEATRRIVTALAEHYKNNPAVIGFQIDNELGNPYSYDRDSLAAFQNWCREKYKTLDALNKAWGTVFWGHTYTAWSQIPLPWNTLFGAHNPSLALDYHRFFSDTTDAYLKLQAGILRRIAPTKAVTTNEMGMFSAVDYSQLNASIDFVAWDNYPMLRHRQSDYFGPALGHDLMRGSKDNQNFMVMEQEGGLPGWTTFWGHQAPAKLYRVWAYQAVAHGADGVCYFRWRTSAYGTEQYWQGILDQDSYPNQRYKMVAQMGKEIEHLTPLLDGSHVASQVAMLVSPDSRWAFQIQPLTKGFNYNGQLHAYYDAFRRRAVNVNVVFPQQDFSGYKVLVAPSLFVLNPALVRKLTGFVNNGGVLVLTYRSGVKDQHNVFTTETLPGPLASLAGIAIHNYDPETTQKQKVVMDGESYPAGVWFDILTPKTAQTLATYGERFYAGQPAVTMNRFGKGAVIYVGTQPQGDSFYDHLIARVADKAGVALGPKLPAGIEMATREKAGKKIIFLLNYTAQPQAVALGETTHDALTDKAEPGEISIPAYGVRVLARP
ncbi:MAG: beta-galactosidase [Acidobacteriota bacterium]